MVYRFLFNSYFISSISSCRRKSLSSTLYCINSLNSRLIDPSANSPEFPIYNIPKRWHLGHSHAHSDHRHHHPPSNREAEKIFRLGLAADIGLAAGKAFTGYLSGSTAIIADAAHSVSDVVLSGVALWSFKAGNAPRDKEHPYGRL